jgi:hypothetical protein
VKPKTSRAHDVFCIFGVASVGVSAYAYATLSESAFYASACLMFVAAIAFMVDSEGEQ